jgi:uncharacterized repeat protein (TIGR03803 family)
MKRIVNALSKLNWGTRACAVLALCAATAIALPAQTATLTTLYQFCSQSGCTDGANPHAGLVQATSGDLYGTTYGGGTNNGGTIFKITPHGTLMSLYSFCSQSGCPDGAEPEAVLVQAANGDLFGTTSGGSFLSYGTIFKFTPGGTLTLYSFCSQTNCTDGASPGAGLVQAASGDLYGTTMNGGIGTPGNGTVFKITPSGTLTTLYSFCSQSRCPDGGGPWAGLIQATNGHLYGTTLGGGANDEGTVFRITPSGTLTTLYSFCSQTNCKDGVNPYAGLVQATNGDFYGTTSGAGTHGYGTAFKITPGGALTTLHRFCSQSGCPDGAEPEAVLVQAANGDLYGTTVVGGANLRGTIFKITPSGTLTTLYSFCSQTNCTDGANPTLGSSRIPMEISTGQRRTAGPAAALYSAYL